MADVALLALGLETGQLKSGANEVDRILDSLQRHFNALEDKAKQVGNSLRNAGTAVKGSAEEWRQFGVSVRSGIGALSGIGGPIGDIAGKAEQLRGQVGELAGAFGVASGAAVGFVAAGAAAAAGITALALQGVKLSTDLANVGNALGFSQSQMERLNAAARISGESLSSLDRSFSQFEQSIKQGIQDPSSDAAKALITLGVDAKRAATDPQGAFLALLSTLDGVTGSIEKQTAAYALFGRSTSALIRTSAEFRSQLALTDEQLVRLGVISTPAAAEAAARVDKAFNELGQTFDTFKRDLVVPLAQAFVDLASTMKDVFGEGAQSAQGFGAAVGAFISDNIKEIDLLIKKLYELDNAVANTLEKRLANALADTIKEEAGEFGRAFREGPFAQLGRQRGSQPFSDVAPPQAPGSKPLTPEQQRSVREFALNRETTFAPRTRGTSGGSRAAADDTVPPEILARLRQLKAEYEAQKVAFDRIIPSISETQNQLDYLREVLRETPGNTREFTQALKEAQDAQAKLNALIKLLPPLISEAEKAALIGAIPSQNPPGANEVGAVVRENTIGQGSKTTIFDENQRKILKREFGYVFEDFYRSVITGRATLKEAFANLALGFADTFATAMIQALQKSFIDKLSTSLTNLLTRAIDKMVGGLQPALTKIFDGLGSFLGDLFKGGGLSKIFGAIGKVFGGLFGGGFGGFFADGGTLGAGKWGVVGERGPELAFSGSRPMTISPMGGMGGGMSLQINFAISAPNGSVSQRTQDQMADAAYNAVQRAQRNRGA